MNQIARTRLSDLTRQIVSLRVPQVFVANVLRSLGSLPRLNDEAFSSWFVLDSERNFIHSEEPTRLVQEDAQPLGVAAVNDADSPSRSWESGFLSAMLYALIEHPAKRMKLMSTLLAGKVPETSEAVDCPEA